MKRRLLSLFLSCVMIMSLFLGFSSTAMAEEAQNQAPVLAEGMESVSEANVLVNQAYLLGKLQGGKVFTDPDGDAMTYYYRISTDNGQTWGEVQGFAEALHGFTTIDLTMKEAGNYQFRFFAVDAKGASSADAEAYWTLKLNVYNKGSMPCDTTFYLSKDHNFSNNGGKHPVLAVYKTAGVIKDASAKEYNYDYVGTYEKDGVTCYVFDPIDYIIEGNETVGYTIKEKGSDTSYALKDYHPVVFTDSNFGKGEGGTPSGTVVSDYNMYYATVMDGDYSYRAYSFNTESGVYDQKLGGTKINIPTDANVDGNKVGGTAIYIREQSLYTSSKKADGSSYFGEEDYHAEVVCPIMKCSPQAGTPYKKGNYCYYPFMLYAGGNACLYNYYVYPDIDGYIFTQSINATIQTGTAALTQQLALNTAVGLKVTAPSDAEFGLYFQYNNFNTGKVDPIDSKDNGDGTTTFSYNVSKNNGNYSWRLSDPAGYFVTKSGWLEQLKEDTELSIDFSKNDYKDKKYHGADKLGSITSLRDEADIQVNLDPSSWKAVGKDDVTRVRAYRMWELINSDTANIMIEPDFHWTVLSGKADVKTLDGGNTTANWADVDPDGTAVVAVSYDALSVYPDSSQTGFGSHGGFYPALSENRTGIFVISDEEAGTADANVAFNRGTEAQTRPEQWDYNYDTWYYDQSDENPVLDFTVSGTNVSKVEYAIVTSKDGKASLSAYKEVQGSDGAYQADLSDFRTAGADGGTVIIRMTDASGISYRLVRVAEVKVTVDNASNPGEDIMPGDQVNLSFDGLYRAVNKQAGIFNPTTFYARYSAGETEVNGTLGQYQAMDRVSIKLQVPEDLAFPEGETVTDYRFTNGYVFGSMYSAANPFRFLYEMTDTGVGTNFNAVTVSLCFQHLSDVTVPVHQKMTYDIAFDVSDQDGNALTDTTISLKNNGTAVEAEEGLYKNLGYGSYSYKIEKEGYLSKTASFTLGSADAGKVEDGVITIQVTLNKRNENAWDGKTKTEPTQVDTVYQISTPAELAWFANAVNGGQTTLKAVLTADIDLGGHEWTPIGTSSKKFAGSFDGQGHVIDHMQITYAAATTTSPYLGFFGNITGASANRASVKAVQINGTIDAVNTAANGLANAYIGGCAGYLSNTDLESVINNVTVNYTAAAGNGNYIGGITGYATGSTIKKSANLADVTGRQYTGGIAGDIEGAQATECYNSGHIKGTKNVAGIAGYMKYNNSNAMKATRIENCGNYGNVTADDYAAGIAGLASTTTSLKQEYQISILRNVFSRGKISSLGKAGAILAKLNNGAFIFDDCYYYDEGLNGIAENAGSLKDITSGISKENLGSVKPDSSFVKSAIGPYLAWHTDLCDANGRTIFWGAAEADCENAGYTGDQICAVCGKVFQAGHSVPKIGHQMTEHPEKAATAYAEGNPLYYSCDVCGKNYFDKWGRREATAEEVILPKSTDRVEKVDGKDPSCTKAGNITYYKADDKFFADKELTQEITLADTVIEATGHNLVKIEGVDATISAKGVAAHYECAICGCAFKDENGSQPIYEKAAVKPFVRFNASSLLLKVKQKTKALKVSCAKGDKVKSWKSSNKKVAVVTSKGVITAKKVGKCKITVTLASGLKKSITVKVQKKAVACTKITVTSKKTLTLKKGKKSQIKYAKNPITCVQKVTFRSSNAKVAAVSKKAVITAKKKGTATITVKCGKKTAKVKVTVK